MRIKKEYTPLAQNIITPAVQQNRTAFYQNLLDTALEERLAITGRTSWLGRICGSSEDKKYLADIDRRCEIFRAVIKQSIDADEMLAALEPAIVEPPVAFEAVDTLALDNDAAADAAVTVV